MKYDVEKSGTSITVRLKGKKLDSAVSSELKGEFLLLCKPRIESLVVDLREVEFCDSSGLSALLIAERKMREHGGKVQLINVHEKVSTLLKISMLDRVFDIKESAGRSAGH